MKKRLQKEGEDWGYWPEYYLVQYFNLEGEKLEKPIVTMFTIKSELESPNVNYYVENGFWG